MPSPFDQNTRYFWEEGKANLSDCLDASFNAAKRHGIEKIVIFTGSGEGARLAADRFLCNSDYQNINVIAVTFPNGQRFTSKNYPHIISADDRSYLKEKGIPVVRAHLPLSHIKAQYQEHGILGQDFSLLGNLLGIFGGSMSLCIQAVLMACDAGEVQEGEHVISLTSDTSIIARASATSNLLTDFVVREILCKPIVLTVSKRENSASVQTNDSLPANQKELPEC